MSARMDALRAAILRPQLQMLEANIVRWNERYDAVAAELSRSNRVVLPERPKMESKVGSSIQFRIPEANGNECLGLIDRAASRGVELKWFGAPAPAGFTSSYKNWHYLEEQSLPQTDEVLSTLFDMRLPLTFSLDDCRLIGQIICEVAAEVRI